MMKLFLCGDVMTGRGIDQVMRDSVDPALYEPNVRDARTYVRLAEEASGAIERAVEPGVIWGAALEELRRSAPDLRIINLETAVTTSDTPAPGKAIHYRMHPKNASCLEAAGVDCCVLANNHVLDWQTPGLLETLDVLAEAGISTAGAGRNAARAAAPAELTGGEGGRVLVFAAGSPTAGVHPRWAAGLDRAGVNLLPDLSPRYAEQLGEGLERHRRAGDRSVASIHWGGNWGYDVPASQRDFAHRLIDAGFDVIHGHSSHHVKGIEVYRGRPILYGCGDLINDYEGIGGYAEYRPDLTAMYFVEMAAGEEAVSLRLAPLQIHRFRLRRPDEGDRRWLADRLSRECGRFGARVEVGESGAIRVSAA